MDRNVPSYRLRVVALDTLDEAAQVIRRELKKTVTSGTDAVYQHSEAIKVRGVDVHLGITLRGPDCRSHVYELDGPCAEEAVLPDGPTPEQMLAAHVAVAKEAYRQVSMTDVGTASWNQLLAQRAELRGTLAALLDAVEKWAR